MSAQASSSSTQWINVLVGRLFYDVFTCQEWSDVVRQRIQRKLNRIKVCPSVHDQSSLSVMKGTFD